MRIMTVGASPYLLVRNGRINSDVLKYFKSLGHEVSSACWHHDEGYFLAEAGTGVHTYEDEKGERICELFPFISHPEQSSPQVYEIMKKVAPEVVITIGDYKETDFLYAIKSMYPVFKWIAVVTVDCEFVHEDHGDLLDYADEILSTSEFGFRNLRKICKKPVSFLPYGVNHDVFKPISSNMEERCSKVICTSKNALASNLGNLIKAVGKVEGMELCLHTNLYDPGEFDLNLLIERFKSFNVSLPKQFVSIKDSIKDEDLNVLYNKAYAVIDCSVKSATALGMLEAMATGCIPVGIRKGRVGEIISQMPEDFQFFIPSNVYIGRMEEEFSVASIKGIRRVLLNMRSRLFGDKIALERARQSAIEVANRTSNVHFLERLSTVVKKTCAADSEITLETFSNT